MAKTATNAPYRVLLTTKDGVTSTAHRTINDAAIMLQILHAEAMKKGERAQLELIDVREEVVA